MSKPSTCPQCNSENIYSDGTLWNCPECFHEWAEIVASKKTDVPTEQENVIRDAHGNVLQDGDTVIVIKDLKVKGASSAIKAGTKVKNIRLQDAGDGHDISCKIDGFGAMNLKSEFVKKA